jgi:hypothetical protein
MRVTKTQLRRIIREAVIQEQAGNIFHVAIQTRLSNWEMGDIASLVDGVDWADIEGPLDRRFNLGPVREDKNVYILEGTKRRVGKFMRMVFTKEFGNPMEGKRVADNYKYNLIPGPYLP